MRTLLVKTRERCHFVHIDRELNHALREFDIPMGVMHVFVPHTTAGITINENADPSVLTDIENALESAVPTEGSYTHAEGNSAAHVKASMMGSSLTVIIDDGRMALGTWQSVYLCEFDGPRTRKVYVSVVPLKPRIT